MDAPDVILGRADNARRPAVAVALPVYEHAASGKGVGLWGQTASQRGVCDLLAQLNYSLQATRKTHEGGKLPDRDAHFSHIADMAAQYQAAAGPVI